MQLFQKVSVDSPRQSQFDAYHTNQTTAEIGQIVPIECTKYFPGDKFNLRYSHACDFPPLIAPANQKFKLKQYTFRVREGINVPQSLIEQDFKAITEGAAEPSFPRIELNESFWHGTNRSGVKFLPPLPCYGLVRNGQIYIREPLTGEISVNRWLFGMLNNDLTDTEMGTFLEIARNSFHYAREDGNFTKFWKFQHDATPATSTTLNVFGLHPAITPVDLNSSITANNVKHYKANKTNQTWTIRYNRPAYNYAGGLLNQLGYPQFIHDYEQERSTWIANINNLIEDYRDIVSTQLPASLMGADQPDDPDFNNQILKHQSGIHTDTQITLPTLLQMYIEFCVMIGKADGSIPTLDEVPLFLYEMDSDMNNIPYKSVKQLDLQPFMSYWQVYNKYFRDSLIQDSMTNFDTDTMSDLDDLLGAYLSQIETNDRDVFGNEWVSTSQTADFDALKLAYKMFEVPQKLLDRDYFRSLLPNVQQISVYAPAVSTLPASAVTTDMTQRVDYKPTTSVSASAFMSLDELKTASTLNKFYKNVYMAGDQPTQLMQVIYGVRSRDFRAEIPELVSASEVDVMPYQITQQSETDQLALGSEGGKLSIFGQSQGNDFIDSDGDSGYFLHIVCVYPVQDVRFGLNPRLLNDSSWDRRLLPQFAELGQQAVPNDEFYFNPVWQAHGNNTALYDEVLGYQERYGNYKFLASAIKGRFTEDLREWNAQILPTNNINNVPSLNYEFFKTPTASNLFASDESNPVKIYSVITGSFVRSVPETSYSVIR